VNSFSASTPLEDPVRDLLERERVRDVIAQYCLSLDAGDLRGVAHCFASGATADYGPGRGGPLEGVAAIVERIARGQAGFRRTHHQLGQICVELAPATANARTAHAVSYVTAWHERSTGEREVVCLRYIDDLQYGDSRWMIIARRVEAAYVDGFPGTSWLWVNRTPPQD